MIRLVAIFLISLYSLTSVGATIHQHYCMGKFAGASLFKKKNGKCARCGMRVKKSSGCCKDQKKFISLKREHGQPSFAKVPLISFTYLMEDFPDFSSLLKTCEIHAQRLKFDLPPPPLILSVKRHLMYGVFLI